VSRGIEIGAPEGDPVTAVFAGRVAFADWYTGYGLLVIVDHGGDYFTLYGHLREVAVRVGDRVDPGALLGRVGETASLTGPNLYFEVREGTDALNPLQWLDRR
jgi:septal ring factor EnvC (AmiA/AmiB activator)